MSTNDTSSGSSGSSGSTTGDVDAVTVLALLIVVILTLTFFSFLPCIIYRLLRSSPKFRAWFHRNPNRYDRVKNKPVSAWNLSSKSCQTYITSSSITSENIVAQQLGHR